MKYRELNKEEYLRVTSDLIASMESFEPKPYDLGDGAATIGYGVVCTMGASDRPRSTEKSQHEVDETDISRHKKLLQAVRQECAGLAYGWPATLGQPASGYRKCFYWHLARQGMSRRSNRILLQPIHSRPASSGHEHLRNTSVFNGCRKPRGRRLSRFRRWISGRQYRRHCYPERSRWRSLPGKSNHQYQKAIEMELDRQDQRHQSRR